MILQELLMCCTNVYTHFESLTCSNLVCSSDESYRSFLNHIETVETDKEKVERLKVGDVCAREFWGIHAYLLYLFSSMANRSVLSIIL